MRIDIHVFLEPESDRLLTLTTLMQQLISKVTTMALDVTQLQAAITAEDTVIDSAITLINGLPALVAAAVQTALTQAGVDSTTAQAAVDAAKADVQSKTAALQAALTANTPA